jgi:hypothetical protein
MSYPDRLACHDVFPGHGTYAPTAKSDRELVPAPVHRAVEQFNGKIVLSFDSTTDIETTLVY